MKRALAGFALFLAAAMVIWLWPSILGGKVLLPLDILSHNPPFALAEAEPIHNELIGDMLFENYTWKFFQRESLGQGQLPLWNPYSFCGHPIYTTGQTSTFYPFNAIFWVVPLPYAYIVHTCAHLLLGGLFMYLFLRRIGIGSFGASVAGVAFAMSGFFAVRFIWPMLLGSAIWLPLMLLWVEVMVEPRRHGRHLVSGIASGAVLFALPILSGFFEIAFYSFAACGLYALWRSAQVSRRDGTLRSGGAILLKTAVVAGLASVLAAPQLLPFFEVMKLNVRAGELTYEGALSAALRPEEALTLLVPDALGNPADHARFDLARRDWQPIEAKNGQDFFYFGPKNYVCTGYYLGLLPFSLAMLSLIAWGRRRWYFWILLVLSAALAFGSPLYRLFFDFVPGADQVRTPFRWMFLASFAVAVLAGIGADDWYSRAGRPSPRLYRVSAWFKMIGAIVLVAVVAGLLFKPEPAYRAAESIIAAYPRAADIFKEPAHLAGLLWTNAMRFVAFAGMAVVLLCLGYLRAWGRAGAATLAAAVLALTAFDLGQATYRFNTHADPAILDQCPPLVKHIQDDVTRGEPFRIGRFTWRKPFHSNLPTLYGITDYGGYDSIILTNFARFMQAIEPQKLLPYNIVMNFEQKSSLDSPLLRLLGIRYMLSDKPIAHPDWERVDVPGNVVLNRLRQDRELPRAFMVPRTQWALDLPHALDSLRGASLDPRHTAVVEGTPTQVAALVDPHATQAGQAAIDSYTPLAVRVHTSAETRQLLVLGDMAYPGWRTYVDRRPTDIMTTNGIFRGVSVPAGDHTVEFRFEPMRLRVGLIASAACIAGLIGVALLGRYRPGGGTFNRQPEPK